MNLCAYWLKIYYIHLLLDLSIKGVSALLGDEVPGNLKPDLEATVELLGLGEFLGKLSITDKILSDCSILFTEHRETETNDSFVDVLGIESCNPGMDPFIEDSLDLMIVRDLVFSTNF
jgi:hypothetical protein